MNTDAYNSSGPRQLFRDEMNFDKQLREAKSMLLRALRLGGRNPRPINRSLDKILELFSIQPFRDGVGVANTYQHLLLVLTRLINQSPGILPRKVCENEIPQLMVNANQGQIGNLTLARWGVYNDQGNLQSVPELDVRKIDDQVQVLMDLLDFSEQVLQNRGILRVCDSR